MTKAAELESFSTFLYNSVNDLKYQAATACGGTEGNMKCFHPGGTGITDAMLSECALSEGSKFLDLGCGDGDTACYISKEYKLEVTGADLSEAMLLRAREAHPEMSFVKCDGQALDFGSCTFDGAMMECSFSLMARQEELLHELFCVLKPGAPLAISDLYILDPDMDMARKNCIEAQRLIYHPREDAECAQEERYPSPFCLDGMFVKELLLALLEDTGFDLEIWEDHTKELRDYSAQLLMDHGSLENACLSLLPEGENFDRFCGAKIGKNTGYFMLVARKRKRV